MNLVLLRSRISTVGLTLVLLLLLPAAGANGIASAEAEVPSIEQLQAVLLLTFARYTEWPPAALASPSAPIVVGVVSDEAVAQALQLAAEGKKVGGRPLVTRRLQWDSDMVGVHMLFVGESERRREAQLIERVRQLALLTVSGLPDFGRAGGMITLKSSGGRISFSVNARATAMGGIRLSSFLLSHATEVSGGQGGEAR